MNSQELLEGELVQVPIRCLEAMSLNLNAASQWPKEEATLRETYNASEAKWQNLFLRIHEFSKQLQLIPDQWSTYRTKYLTIFSMLNNKKFF